MAVGMEIFGTNYVNADPNPPNGANTLEGNYTSVEAEAMMHPAGTRTLPPIEVVGLVTMHFGVLGSAMTTLVALYTKVIDQNLHAFER